MALSGTLTADFSSFSTAVDSAVVKLTDFEANSGKVSSALSKMANSLTGNTIVAQATIAAEAVDRIGGVSKLTEAELARLGATATEAAAKLTALGKDVPPGIQAIADAATKTGQSFSDWAGQLNIKDAINDPLNTAKEGLLAFAETLGPTGIAMAAVGGAAVAIGAGLFELASNAGAAGEAVKTFSLITGSSVEATSQLAQAATIGGSSLDNLQQMLFQMQKRMDATGPAADKFNAGLADLGINADAFRAADPTERIAMLSAGLQASAGSTNLMSDAIAVMGRGAMTAMPFLVKNFADLEAQAKTLGYTMSQDDVDASVKFGDATRALGVQVTGVSTEIGMALLPAMTGLVKITSDFFGFVVQVPIAGIAAGFHAYAEATGISTVAQANLNSAVSISIPLFAAANIAYGNTAEIAPAVAASMLKVGVSIQDVATVTKLSVVDITMMKGSMDDAAKAATDLAAAQSRIANAVDLGATSLKGFTQDQQDYVVGMLKGVTAGGDYNQRVQDLIATTTTWNFGLGLNKDQILLMTKAQTDSDAVSAKNDVTIQHLTDSLQKAADKEALLAAAFDAKQIEQNTVAWDAYALGVVKASGTATDVQLANNAKTFNDAIAKLDLEFSHVKVWTDETTAQYELAYNAKAALNKQANDAILNDDARVAKGSIESLTQEFQKQQQTLNDMMTGDLHYSQARIQNQRDVLQAAKDAMQGIVTTTTTGSGQAAAAFLSSTQQMSIAVYGVDTTSTTMWKNFVAHAQAAAAAVGIVTADLGTLDTADQNLNKALLSQKNDYTTQAGQDAPQGTVGDLFATIARFGGTYQEAAEQVAIDTQARKDGLIVMQQAKDAQAALVASQLAEVAHWHALGVPGFAEGGTVAKAADGGVVMVGERGPEVVRLPFGSQVFPNGVGLGGGTTITVVIAPSGVIGSLDAPSMQKLGQIAGDAAMARLKTGRQIGSA